MRTIPTVLCLAAFLSTITLVEAAVADSLAVGQSIKDNETVISAEGSFCLGFFTGRANNRYLGIWFNRIPVRTVVWVANRRRPLPGSAGSLNMTRNGSLVLADAAGTTYWSADPAAALSNPVVRLLDDGNLVVVGGGGDGYAWQSFADPTDTLLSGMRLGWDRRTGKNLNLTSWKATDDPAPGDDSWVVVTRGVPQLFLMKGSVPLWRGGPWVRDRFTGIPNMKDNNIFSYAFNNNPDELYFKFDVWNKATVTRITVDPSGFSKHLVWDDASGIWVSLWASENDTCDSLGVCGANALCDVDRSPVCGCPEGFEPKQQQRGAATAAAGCQRQKPSDCPGGEDTFVLVAGAKLPDTSVAAELRGVGLDGCRAACLRNCSCTAFTSSDGSCITWFGDLTDLRVYRDLGQDLYVRVAAVGLPPPAPQPSGMHAAMGKLLLTALCLALCLSTALGPAAAADLLSAGESIRDGENLTSAELGNFVLGFFPGRSNNTYLGIWYNRIPCCTVVWVANRQRPLPGSNGTLTLLQNGTLILADAKGTVYWSTGTSTPTLSSPVARLLDDGNLVVLNRSDNSYAWQSFAHPTDSLLRGMNMGLNRRTGENFNITSWRSADDPAPGDYSLGIDMRGVPQLLVMNGSTPLWRGGPWIGERFAGIPDMWNNGVFKYAFTSSRDSLYFTYDVWNKNMLTRILVNQSGFMEHVEWDNGNGSWTKTWASGNGTCEKVGACGPYGLCDENRSSVCGCIEGFEPKQQGGAATAAAGCQRKRPLDCPRRDDTFVVVAGAKLPDTSVAAAVQGVGWDGCRAACLRNCSCTAFSRSDGSGCITWFGDLTDLRVYNAGGQDLYVRFASEGEKNRKKVIIIIITLIAIVMIMILLFFCLWRRRQMSIKRLKEMLHIVEERHGEECDQGSDFVVPLFHFNTLELATHYFSFQNKLGEGGYGPVYKGEMHDGQCVAIKRLSKDSTQGLEQFKSEVQLVAKLQHTNLVRLLGCCIENDEKILVYEYMHNQSLDRFIFDANKGRQLDWAKRLHIIEGITQGLLYLHKYSRLRVIHRDLKASNILLDSEWNPKISDFGLARIFSWNERQANTKRIIGTYGYMPPEYAMKGLFSIKSDVFSFGVLLLEILSGKKNTSINDFGISRNLPGHAWELWREGRQLELADPAMDNLTSIIEFSRCIHVALLCVQENPVDRPTMLDVVSMLNNDTTNLPTPSQPGFFLVRHSAEEGKNLEIEQFSSSNSVTLSRVEGR